MRIVHYSQHVLAGESGTGNSIRGWCEALHRKGIEVSCIVDAARIAIDPPEGPEFIGLPHRLSGRLRMPQGLGKAIGSADLLVAHGGWLPSNNFACRIARKFEVPYIVTTHGVYFPQVMERNPALKWAWKNAFERRHLNRASALHVLFLDEEEGIRRLGVSTRTIVAPNGITPPPGVTWDGGSGGYLLWLGRFDPEHKGLDLLIRAVDALPSDARPRLRLHGPDWKGSKRGFVTMVERMGLGSYVSVGEPVYGEDKWSLLARATGFVYPSRWEGSPMAVAEAISIGVPTLVTEYPMGRFLGSLGAALVVEATPQKIAQGIQRLLGPAAHEVGPRGAAVARQELSWEAVADSWIEQVKAILASG